MIKINRWSAMVAIVFGLFISISLAEAQQPYDITECYSFTFTTLSESEDSTFLGMDAKAIVRSNDENKLFDNCTIHCVGIRRVVGGKTDAHGYFKYMDPNGDFFIMEGMVLEGEIVMKFFSGIGKWKGIKGEGRIKIITRGKPIIPGTAQVCYRHTGTFELPQ